MTHAWFSTMDKCTISLRLEFSTGLSMQMPNISSCFSLSLYLTAATAWNKAYNITANQRLGTHGATHWLSSCIWFIFPCYVNPYRALPLHLPPGSLLVQLLQGRCRAARKDTFFLFMLFKLKVSPPHHELNRVLRQAPAAASPPSRYWTAPRFENCGTYRSFDYSRSNAFHVNLLQADLISLMSCVLLQAWIWIVFFLNVTRKKTQKATGSKVKASLAGFHTFFSKAPDS